jgi:hypothetical protein
MLLDAVVEDDDAVAQRRRAGKLQRDRRAGAEEQIAGSRRSS